MSIPVEILKAIQCSASKQRHILRDPVLLECGHSACRKCIKEHKKFMCSYPNCEFLNEIEDENNLKNVKSIETLINSYLDDLFNLTSTEYNELVKKFKDEGHESLIDYQCHLIEKQIYERVDSLMNQLEQLKKILLTKLNSKKLKLKRLIAYQASNLMLNIENGFEFNLQGFYEVHSKLVELKSLIEEFTLHGENPHFKLNDCELDESIIGKVYITSCNTLFLKHKLLTCANPFNFIKFQSEAYGTCVIGDKLCISFPDYGKLCIFSPGFRLLSIVYKVMDVTFNCPRGLTSNNCNDIVICDSYCHRLLICDYEFETIRILGKYGKNTAEFYSPLDALFHDQHLYVCDTGNKRIQKFTDNYGFLRQFQFNFQPIQIKIISKLAIIRDEVGFLRFYDLDSFYFLKKSTTQGIIGVLDECMYQIDTDYVHFFDCDGNLNSTIKVNKLKHNYGSSCVFNKSFVVTGNENKLYVIEDLL